MRIRCPISDSGHVADSIWTWLALAEIRAVRVLLLDIYLFLHGMKCIGYIRICGGPYDMKTWTPVFADRSQWNRELQWIEMWSLLTPLRCATAQWRRRRRTPSTNAPAASRRIWA